jgi:hypothetical protein
MCDDAYKPYYPQGTLETSIRETLERTTRANPFRDSVRFDAGELTSSQGGGWVATICTELLASNFCPTGSEEERCAPILAEGSEDITASSCSAAGPDGTIKDCNLLYTYSEEGGAPRTATYCDFELSAEYADPNPPGDGGRPNGLAEPSDCTAFTDQETCVAHWSAPSYYAKGQPYTHSGGGFYASQRYVYCRWAGANGCKPKWAETFTSPYKCVPPPEQCDTEVGVCKGLLCGMTIGGETIDGVREDDAACSL